MRYVILIVSSSVRRENVTNTARQATSTGLHLQQKLFIPIFTWESHGNGNGSNENQRPICPTPIYTSLLSYDIATDQSSNYAVIYHVIETVTLSMCVTLYTSSVITAVLWIAICEMWEFSCDGTRIWLENLMWWEWRCIACRAGMGCDCWSWRIENKRWFISRNVHYILCEVTVSRSLITTNITCTSLTARNVT